MRPTPQFRTALGLSALAHAVLLVGLLGAARPAAFQGPLALHLVALPQPSEEAAAPGPVALPAQARPSPPHPSRPVAARRIDAVLQAPVETAVGTEFPPAREEATAAAAEGPGPSSGVGPGAASGGEGGDGPRSPGASSLLGELHRRLAEAARRCYPAAARRFQLQGEVPVHFCLDAHGAATALRLEGSTGSPLLDASALECVVPGAAPLPALPGCFLVPVRFGG